MATQQGISLATHHKVFCDQRVMLALGLHLCRGVWYHRFQGGVLLGKEDGPVGAF